MTLLKTTLTALLHENVVAVTTYSDSILIEFTESTSPALVNNILSDAQLEKSSWGIDGKSIYVYAQTKEN